MGDRISSDRIFHVEGINVETQKAGQYDLSLNLVIELQEMKFVPDHSSIPDIGKYQKDLDLSPYPLVLYNVENHLLQAFLQWFSKNPGHRRLGIRKSLLP